MKKWEKALFCLSLTHVPAAFPLSVCVCVSFLTTLTQIKAVLARGRMKDLKTTFLSLLGSLLTKIVLIFITVT